jgi:DNA-binding CsgD family transcriptional regulator
MSLDERVSDLIKRTYCAGDDPNAWDQIALDLMNMCGGCIGLTTVVDLKNREFNSYRFYGPETSTVATGIEEYAEAYVEDPSLIWASANPHARFCHSGDTIPADDYLTNEFIRWNHAHFGSTHWHVGYSAPEDDLSFSFSIHFPATEGPGDPEAVRLFKMMFDHMECAVRLGRRPFNVESNRSLFLLDSAGSVSRLSKGAERYLASGGALRIEQRRLVTASPAEQARLDRAIATTLNTVRIGTRPQALELHPVHGRRSIVVIRPMLSSYGPFGQVRCELMVEVHDGLPRIESVDVLQSLFGLTGRELQVVRLLADGHSIESLAACMDISPNTAKTHMRAIVAKTQTSRQSELMHLCAGLSESA